MWRRFGLGNTELQAPSIFIIGLLLCAASGIAHGDDVFDRTVRPFLTQHCVKCHSKQKAKAELRLDLLKASTDHKMAETWADVLEKLRAGEMPPKKQPRPAKNKVAAVQKWIEEHLDKAGKQAAASGGRMIIRRLNRTEYDNTIRDLFGVDLKPARVFPEDDSAHGFDNVGSALTVSPLLIEKYMNVAQWITQRTIYETKPKIQKHKWAGSKLAYGKYIDRCKAAGVQPPGDVALFYQIGPQPNGNKNLTSYPVAFPRPHFQAHVPGRYILRIKAHAIGGGVSPKMRYRIYWETKHLENYFKGDLAVILKVNKDGALFDRAYLTRKPEVYEFSTHLEPGQEFSYNFENGPPNVNVERVGRQYPGPGMVISWVEVEGPIFDSWPAPSHRNIFFRGPDAKKDRAYAAAILKRFATRAFRRPVENTEVATLLQLFDRRQKEGDSFERSVAAGIELALCSPSFLYLAEPSATPQQKRRLNAYELASRLSYFLWSSMPDQKLFELAEKGTLTRDSNVLEAQVRRMLKDPKARALTEDFVGQWLKLRKLKMIAVDQMLFPSYSDYLKTLFVRETEAFYQEILDHDLSILNFIDSDFAMLNDRLAIHYGIEGVRGHEFRRVKLNGKDRRGGLTGQSSILTLTTCGTRTSPVMRGTWVLETMLGIEPPPPPKDVPALTPDTKGATTIRQRLAQHRADPTCAQCHDKIDPLGLALENYNVIGVWREDYGKLDYHRRYRKGKLVDASAMLITGEKFTGPDGLRDILMKKKDRFTHAFVEKMLTYALGRGLDLGDRKTVEALSAKLKSDGYIMSNLIVGVVKSEPFGTK